MHSIAFQPVFEGYVLYVLIAVLLISNAIGVIFFNFSKLRFLAITAFILFILNPVSVSKKETQIKDIALLILDDSESQTQAGRAEQSTKLYDEIAQKISAANKELISLKLSQIKPHANSTEIYGGLLQSVSEVNPARFAGVVVVTDGLASDKPKSEKELSDFINLLPKKKPIHFLITKKDNEKDAWIEIVGAQKHGFVNEAAKVDIIVHAENMDNSLLQELTIKLDSGEQIKANVSINKKTEVQLPLKHAGKNNFRLDIARDKSELSLSNNSELISVSAARERMKVLLVTGKVYGGQRVWRNYLKADPAIDLVHFNILRNIQDDNRVPNNQMSLIPFPVAELFGDKLGGFDLVIIDQFPETPAIPDAYLKNIADYVLNGGPLLFVAGEMSDYTNLIFQKDFADILPFTPLLSTAVNPFIPKLTAYGLESRIAAPLINILNGQKKVGSWYRVINAALKNNVDILLETPDAKPILIKKQVSKGRVAALLSDQIWLWARGVDGGGPYQFLVKNIIHWLLHEPELEDKFTNVSIENKLLKITAQKPQNLTITMPDGEIKKASVDKNTPVEFALNSHGVVTVESDVKEESIKFYKTYKGDGAEFKQLLANSQQVDDMASRTGGGVIVPSNLVTPEIKAVNANSPYKGNDWLGFVNNNITDSTDVDYKKIIPDWVLLLLIFISLGFAWVRQR